MSLKTLLQRLNVSYGDIKTSIRNKGVVVADSDGFEDFSSKIDQIEQGSNNGIPVLQVNASGDVPSSYNVAIDVHGSDNSTSHQTATMTKTNTSLNVVPGTYQAIVTAPSGYKVNNESFWNSGVLNIQANETKQINLVFSEIVIANSTLVVYTEGAGSSGRWSIDNGTTWRSSSDVVEIPNGTQCTITFKEVSGWKKPADIVFTPTGGDYSKTGTYTPINTLTVNIEMEDN